MHFTFPVYLVHHFAACLYAGQVAFADGAVLPLPAGAPAEPGRQVLYGVRPEEQLRLAREGHRVRVYVPYGVDWYGYYMRRLAEKPANLALLGRALISRR